MQTGKLPFDLLSELLKKIEIRDPRVFVGPRPGEDAALIDFGDRYLVAKTDPITFATDLVGWYMVHVNANDLVVMGATPRWLMATVLLPEDTNRNAIESVFDQISDACRGIGVTLVGGHTEITHGLKRPIVVGAMLGEVAKDRFVLTSGAQLGDRIVLTKGIAIEGTSILARDAGEKLIAAGISKKIVMEAKNLLVEPGISVISEAVIASNAGMANAMHDPTEGGLATGLLEMASASGLGLKVFGGGIPLLPECKLFCEALGIDPLGLIASGSLLAAVKPSESEALIGLLTKSGIEAYEIGFFTDQSEGLVLEAGIESMDLPRFDRDEIARYFGD